jgi:hypothetical protein
MHTETLPNILTYSYFDVQFSSNTVHEQKYNLTKGLLEKSKLAQYVYEEGHKLCWRNVKVLQIELNTTYKKYKKSAHIFLAHLLSQLSLDASPNLTPIIAAEV